MGENFQKSELPTLLQFVRVRAAHQPHVKGTYMSFQDYRCAAEYSAQLFLPVLVLLIGLESEGMSLHEDFTISNFESGNILVKGKAIMFLHKNRHLRFMVLWKWFDNHTTTFFTTRAVARG